MKHILPWILLFTLTGCCRVAELPLWPGESKPDTSSALYRFRLERSAVTKFSGLLALKPREDGMWSVLLDATGIPLVKMLVHTDGTKQVEYCAATLCDSRLPELLGKVVEYIYFKPANADCPWYAFFSVCLETKGQEQHKKILNLGHKDAGKAQNNDNDEHDSTNAKAIHQAADIGLGYRRQQRADHVSAG